MVEGRALVGKKSIERYLLLEGEIERGGGF